MPTENADILNDTSGDDVIDALGGDDEIHVSSGSDLIDGGGGVDTLFLDYGYLTGPLVDHVIAGYDFAYQAAGGPSVGFRNVERLIVTSGSGDDDIATGATEDQLDLGAGSDSADSGAGDDRLDGGSGDDSLTGGTGDDIYVVDAAGDVVIENADEGTDEIRSGLADYSLAALAYVENLTGTSAAGQQLTGNGGVNVVTGASGNDTIDGGAGADTMAGAAGNDVYLIDDEGDEAIEAEGEGSDEIRTTLQVFGLGDHVEKLTYAGTVGSFTGIGNGLANLITGGASSDLLDGGAGADTLIGGAGDDTYDVDSLADVVTEIAGGGAADTVRTALVAYTLAAEVEILVGLSQDGQQLTGNMLANELYGQSGNDRLDGGAGADQMAGGAGNDVYLVDEAGDGVVEQATGGTDEIRTILASYSIAALSAVENLTLTGAAAGNATGNSGANALTGNGAANRIDGGAGADTMTGGGGNDVYVVDNAGDSAVEAAAGGTDRVESSIGFTLGAEVENLTLTGSDAIDGSGNTLVNSLTGNGAANRLDGKAGADAMTGGAGNDVYVADNAGDSAVEAAAGGTDRVESSVGFTLGAEVENLTLTGANAIDGNGNALANSLTGNGAANRLDGKAGADTMTGGAGNDVYVADNAGDTAVEAAAGGTDRVESSVGFTLGAEVENLTLTGIAAIDGTGNALVNSLTGNGGANRLDGKAGADTMTGGAGNDIYVVDNSGDVAAEVAGGGTDRVESSVSHTLGTALENLTLTGIAAINGTGNAAVNALVGNSGANRLDGKAGADTMTGGAGDDVYVVDVWTADAATPRDTIVELAGGGGDTVESTVTYVLPDQVEKLILKGALAIDGTGNALANSLTGNGAANRLDGKAGADTMTGGGGNDVFIVDNAGDITVEAAAGGTDRVDSSVGRTLAAEIENLTLTGTGAINGIGNALANTLIGNGAANRLDGKAGTDTLKGGAGDDYYILDTRSLGSPTVDDVVVELAGGGTDTVESKGHYVLSANVENLILVGSMAINATGNGLANHLTGNATVNTLDGRAGADTMSGGGGHDTYLVDDPLDKVVETAIQFSVDLVKTSVSYTLGAGARVETLRTTDDAATTALNLTGNEFVNTLIGNAGNNILNGKAGADTMRGGDGSDTYHVDNAGDKVEETILGDTDTVYSSVNFTTDQNIERIILTGTAALNATGLGTTTITGNSAANRLQGGTMIGGLGDDRYVIFLPSYKVVEAAGAGLDTVEAYSSYALPDHVENLTLLGPNNDFATGNALANVLTGNAQANVLDGKAGADTMKGGAGQDTYFVDDKLDKIVETGGEFDTVRSSVSYTLAAGVRVEQLETTNVDGTAAINFTGNEWENRLYGNAGANRLDGGTGADILTGGPGNDVYIVDSADDIVQEHSGATEGIDEIRTALASFTLDYNFWTGVEKLTGTSATGQKLTGNDLDNVITGGAGNDTLEGKGGLDTLVGGAGNDLILWVEDGDLIVENAGEGTDEVRTIAAFYSLAASPNVEKLTGFPNFSGQHLVGNAGANVITAGSTDDTLDGGGGNDVMKGGAGNDTYVVNAAGDVITELAGEGHDRVSVTVATFSMAALSNVEELNGTLNTGHMLTGNAEQNLIFGAGGADTLNGAGGSDTLFGAGGNDKLYGKQGRDVLNGSTGADGFYFDTALDATNNLDFISFYNVADDTIFLDDAIFGMAVGALNPAAFHTGTAAADASDRIIHDAATGQIFYDPDGTGAAAAIQFAKVTAGLALTAADFIVF